MIVVSVPLAVFLVFLVFSVFLVVFVFGVGAGVGGLGDGLLSRWGLPAWVRFPLPSAFPVFWVFGFSGSQVSAVGGEGEGEVGGRPRPRPAKPILSPRSGVLPFWRLWEWVTSFS